MTTLFGLGDEFGEDAILGKLEGMKDVIEKVNKQFKDPVRFNASYQDIHFCCFSLENDCCTVSRRGLCFIAILK